MKFPVASVSACLAFAPPATVASIFVSSQTFLNASVTFWSYGSV